MDDPRDPGPRQRLLEAAARLFYAQGYHATGINQLIEEASVAKASFYHHFRSKEDLGAAYLRKAHESWIVAVDRHLEGFTSPRERILGLFDFLKSRKEEDGFRGCAFINSVAEVPSYDSAMRAASRDHYDFVRGRVRGLLEENGHPSIPPGSRDEVAEALVLLFEGALVSSQTYEAAWPIDMARSAAARLLDTL